MPHRDPNRPEQHPHRGPRQCTHPDDQRQAYGYMWEKGGDVDVCLLCGRIFVTHRKERLIE